MKGLRSSSFKRSIIKREIRGSRQRLKTFAGLPILDMKTRIGLINHIRFQEKQLSIWNIRTQLIGFRTYFILICPLFLWILFGNVLFMRSIFDIKYSTLIWVVIYILNYIIIAVSILLLSLPLRFKKKIGIFLFSFLYVTLIAITLFFFYQRFYKPYLYSGNYSLKFANFLLAIWLSGIASSCIYWGIILLFFVSWTIIRENYLKRLHPEFIMTNRLLSILDKVERNQLDWTELGFKQGILSDLEKIALCFQKYLPRRLEGRDTFTDAWSSTVFKRLAESVREKKKWIITPKADTRSHFLLYIANSLVNFASGNWDYLEQKSLEDLSIKRLLNLPFASAIKFILVIILPLIAFIIIEGISREIISGHVEEYAKISYVIWVVTAILAKLNPDYKENIKDVQGYTKAILGR